MAPMTIPIDFVDRILGGVQNAGDLCGEYGLMRGLKIWLAERLLCRVMGLFNRRPVKAARTEPDAQSFAYSHPIGCFHLAIAAVELKFADHIGLACAISNALGWLSCRLNTSPEGSKPSGELHFENTSAAEVFNAGPANRIPRPNS